MAKKFHINSEGEPGRCRAQPGRCPFASDSDHYASAADARMGYEKLMRDQNSIAANRQEMEQQEKLQQFAANEAEAKRLREKGKFQLTEEFGDTFSGWNRNMQRFYDPRNNAQVVRCPAGCRLYMGTHVMDDASGHVSVSWSHESEDGHPSNCQWGVLPPEYTHPFIQSFVEKIKGSEGDDKVAAIARLQGTLSAFRIHWNGGNSHNWEPRLSYDEIDKQNQVAVNAAIENRNLSDWRVKSYFETPRAQEAREKARLSYQEARKNLDEASSVSWNHWNHKQLKDLKFVVSEAERRLDNKDRDNLNQGASQNA